MSFDMTSGNSWPSDHTGQPCRICFCRTPRNPQDGCCDECNGFSPETRTRPVVDHEPVAVVWPGRKAGKQDGIYTFWARGEWAGEKGRALLVAHARNYARLTGGRMEVIQ